MERSRKIFRKIASASRRVVAAANDYADCEDSNGVPRCHFQLEEDMRRISVACECLIRILNKPPPEEGPAVDVRIQDWLNTEEPEECIRTLDRMVDLLRKDTSRMAMSWIFQRGRRSTTTQDKIKGSVDLFNSRKRCFHFLFSVEIWNNEETVQKRKDVTQPRDHIVQGESGLLKSMFPAIGVNAVVSLDPGVHKARHAERVIREGTDFVDQSFPAHAQGDIDTTELETVNYDDRHVVTQRRLEIKNSKQREVEEKKLEEISKWLDGLNCAEKQDATLLLRQEDTCKWLFDTSQYKTWKDAGGASLWLRGKPGAGKSVLASFVIDSFRKEGELLIFFYCDIRNEQSTSSAGVMRSILSQLLRRLYGRSVDLGNILDDLKNVKEWGGGALSNAKELAGFASRAARLSSQKPLVVVDALDECKDIQKLIQALMVIRGHVRLFVTSRPLHNIMDDLSDLPYVSMDDMANKLSVDIELHVTRELDARQRLRDLDSGFKKEISSILCHKADGMFRWVQCSIDTLDRCVTRKEVRSSLNSLPEGLDETYERILLAIHIDTPAGQLALRALIWLVAALRPLRLSEIIAALEINLQTRTLDPEIGPMHRGALLDACGSLVTYTEKTGIIILSHSSVKEYLTSEFTRVKLSQYHISLEHAHLLLARSCMCYISICLKYAQGPAPGNISDSISTVVSSQPKVRLHKSQPLLGYVLDDALGHFGYLGSMFKSALQDVAVLAEDIQRHAWIWDHMYIPARQETRAKPHWPMAMHDLLLYVLVAFASDSFVNMFFRRNALKAKEGTNPLVYAAYFNKDEHARILLLQGARLNQRGWETIGFRQSLPIEVAYRDCHYAMVTLFVEEGCIVPQYMFTGSFFNFSEYNSPVLPSHVARVLIQTDEFAENVNNCLDEVTLHTMLESNHLFKALQEATEQDFIAIIQRLIQVANERLTPNSIGDTFFRFAVAQGHISAARYLFALGTSLPSDILVTMGHYSGRWKSAHMIQFLVDNGADVFAHTSSGNSVLHTTLWAPDVGFFDTVNEDDVLGAIKLLVGYGCDPIGTDSCGDTPLHIAVKRGYISIARYLLTLGALVPPDLFITLDRSPRSHWCTMSMIHFLVENGVDIRAHTDNGDSVLHIVLRSLNNDSETLEALKLLVGRGCDSLEANACGKTPLHIAVEQGHVSAARYLVSLGALVPPDLLITLDWSPRSPRPHWCTMSMIHFLVENGVDIHAHTDNGDSVLHIALRSSYNDDEGETLEALKLLVGCGCDSLEANARGETPLHIAVERGHVSAARYLVSLGALVPPDLLITLNWSPWSFRSRWRTPSMIHFLVKNGADIHAHTDDGDSVLHLALHSTYKDGKALEVLKLLVGCGCDSLEANARGETPLHIAVERGHVSAARYLVSLGALVSPDLFITLDRSPRSRWCTPSVIHFLVKNGVDIHAHTDNGDSVLHIVLRSLYNDGKALEALKLLVGYGCDSLEANARGKTPLHIAVEQGYVSAARYLVSLGALVPPDLFITLDRSPRSRWCTPSMIHFLVENGVDIHAHTDNGDSVLHIALRSSYNDGKALEALKLLVGYGCDSLEANARGETPLHTAAKRSHVSVARYLIAQGACVLTKASNGDTVLHFATGGVYLHRHFFDVNPDACSLKAVRFFVARGCETAAFNDNGRTPLHVAVDLGRIKTAEYLLSLNVPLPPDILFTAIQSDNNSVYRRDIIETLVTYGCDTLTPNSEGVTPLKAAIIKGKVDVVEYLLSVSPSAHNPPFENIFSATALAPPSVQGEMKRMLSDRRARSESPDLLPAKRAKYS